MRLGNLMYTRRPTTRPREQSCAKTWLGKWADRRLAERSERSLSGMRQRSALLAFLLGSLQVGAASSLAVLASCNDFVTGQDPEPPGPLLVTRVTLFDPA